MSLFLKNTIKTSIVNYIGIFIGFVSILFIQTKVLSEDEIGVIRLLVDKALLFVHFFMFGMQSVASRFYFHFEDNKRSYGSFLTLILGFPLVTIILGLIFSYLFQLNLQILHFNYIAFILFFYIYIQIFESYLFTKQKIVFPSFLRNILFKLLFIFGLFLYYNNIINFEQLLLFYVGIYFIHFTILLLYFRKFLTFNFEFNIKDYNQPIFKEIATYSLFLILGAGTVSLISKIDTIMIENITSNQSFVGIYAIAFAIANIIEVVKTPVVKLSGPIISKKLKQNKLSDVLIIYRKSSINLMIAGFVIFILVWFNIDLIFSIIPNGEIYKEGKYVVFFIGLAKLLDLSLGVNYEIIQNSDYYKWNIFLTPFLAVLAIILNIYFVSKYSYVGAAIATAISIFTYNILRTILVVVKLKMHPFDLKYIKALSLIFIPVILSFFIAIENLFLKLLLNILVVLVTFILPIYFMRISDEFNNIIDILLGKLRIKKISH